MRKKFTTVSIPSPLFEKVERCIEGTGFTSVSSFVTFLLRELTMEYKEGSDLFGKKERESLIEKLKALGYFD